MTAADIDRDNLPFRSLPGTGRWVVRTAKILAVYLAAGGALSFAGWAADLRRLTDWFGTGISIQPDTALAGAGAGLALYLQSVGWRHAARLCGLLVGIAGGTALFQWVTGLDLGLHLAPSFDRAWGQAGVLYRGRMGPPSALSWTLIGLGFMLAAAPMRSRVRPVVPIIATVTVAISSLSIIGYIDGVNALYSLPATTVIAFQTATFILAASLGLFLLVDEHGPMPLVRDAGPAGIMVRRILPAIFAVPIALGVARLAGDRVGAYSPAFGTAMQSISEIGLLLALLGWSASVIRRQSQARELAERAVEASERRLRTIVDTVAAPLWEEDVSYLFASERPGESTPDASAGAAVRAIDSIRVLDVNDAAVTLFQAADEAELIAALPALLRAGAPSLLADRLAALADGRREFRAEVALHTLRGAPMHVALTTVLSHARQQEARALVSVQDLTEQKRVEEALRQSQTRLERDLADSQQLQRISAEIIHDENEAESIYDRLVDAARVIAHAHGSKIQMLEDAAPGEPGRLRLIAARGLAPRAVAFWASVGTDSPSSGARAMRSGGRVVVADVLACPVLAGTADLEIYLDSGIRAVQSTPLLSRSGKLMGVLSTHWDHPHEPSARELDLVDVLAREAADLIERRQHEDAMRLADRRKDEFLMTLAHELRNPLAPMRSAVDLMKAKRLADPDLERARGLIDRQVTLMARLLDDLLDVGRIARDRLELRREPVDLRAVIRGALELNATLVEAFHHQVHLDLPVHPVMLHGDPVRLGQIVGNLINNACRYTPTGGHVWVTARLDGQSGVLSVKDSGIGIPADQLSSIFGIFSQVDRSLERSRGGLGIGLHLVRRLVGLHGGTIEAESEGEGRGSCFTVRLPADAASDLWVPPAAPAATARVANLSILVVDDNVDAASALTMLLELDGHEVREAHDGLEALEVAEAFRPDVILLDVGLPRLNGLDVCRRIRSQAWGEGMVLVALTGWSQNMDRRLSHEAGFDHHVVKPVEIDDLRALLARSGPAVPRVRPVSPQP
jgi:signal transduction histidine kinase/ActR/RegA family two-component response regulator/PAS domain-containing protein